MRGEGGALSWQHHRSGDRMPIVTPFLGQRPRRLMASFAVCASIAVSPCAAQDANEERDGDAITIEPNALLQLDAGGPIAGSGDGDVLGAGANFRRARLGIVGHLPEGFEFTLEWDFGGRPGSHNRIYEASAAWTGIDGVSVRAGAFEPNFSLQQDRSAQALLFLERSAVVDIAREIATDTARVAFQARANGDRWFASAAVTGGQAGPSYDGSERGAVLRVTGLPIKTDDLTVHAGVSLARSFRPKRGSGKGGERGFSFTATPELSLASGDPALDTGAISADGGHAAGLEGAFSWRRWQAQGEIYRIGVDHAEGGWRFSGWYVEVSRVLAGRSRDYQARNATWDAPRTPDEDFNPAAGSWGTLEAGARYSRLDLNDRDVRGGRQQVWTAGLAWWPVRRFALQLQYQAGSISNIEDNDRTFHAVAVRTQLVL
ncbi:hypothetical protein DMC47_20285 [Nostoc sp. 3335mG]|nr:hypothetical protein DMC47_20285 [Nostoc sp. 3335mG]